MATTHNKFTNIPEHRTRECKISLADALMSGYAIFALKDPSLMSFDNRRMNDDNNLKRVFGIQNVASDSQLREILDPVDPELIRPIFSDIFYQLQRGKALEPLFVRYKAKKRGMKMTFRKSYAILSALAFLAISNGSALANCESGTSRGLDYAILARLPHQNN